MGHVFVSSTAQTDQDERVLRPAAGVTEHPGECVRSFESGDDSFQPADTLKSIQRLIIGGRLVADPPAVLEPAVLGTNTGVVQSGRDRMGRQHLPIFILKQVAQTPMQDAGLSRRESGTMMAGPNTLTARLDSDQLDFGIIQEAGKETDRIGAAADACHRCGRKPAIALQHLARAPSSQSHEIAFLAALNKPDMGKRMTKLVRVHAAGICGSDRELYQGNRPEGYVRYPLTPGHEWSGTVAEVGPGVPDSLVGRKVVGEGFRNCQVCDRCHEGETTLCSAGYEETGFTLPGAMATTLTLPAPGCAATSSMV